jgi:hypothetical protein
MKNSKVDAQKGPLIAWRQREDCGPDIKGLGNANRKSLSSFYPNGFEATGFRRGEADGETMRTELKAAFKSLPLTRGAGTAALPYRTACVHAEKQGGSRGEASSAAMIRGKGDGIPAEDPEVLARPGRKWSAVACHGLEEQRLGQREKEQVAKFKDERWAQREQHWLGKFEDQRMAKPEQELPTQMKQQRLDSLGKEQTADQKERQPKASQKMQRQKQLVTEAEQRQQQLASQDRQQPDYQQHQLLLANQDEQRQTQLANRDEQRQPQLANQDEQQQELAYQDEQQHELATLEERRLAKLDAGVRKEMQLLQGRAQVTIFPFLTDFCIVHFSPFRQNAPNCLQGPMILDSPRISTNSAQKIEQRFHEFSVFVIISSVVELGSFCSAAKRMQSVDRVPVAVLPNVCRVPGALASRPEHRHLFRNISIFATFPFSQLLFSQLSHYISCSCISRQVALRALTKKKINMAILSFAWKKNRCAKKNIHCRTLPEKERTPSRRNSSPPSSTKKNTSTCYMDRPARLESPEIVLLINFVHIWIESVVAFGRSFC